MSDKTDYKKLWRKERENNIRLHKAIIKASDEFRQLLSIPGVVELIKNYNSILYEK